MKPVIVWKGSRGWMFGSREKTSYYLGYFATAQSAVSTAEAIGYQVVDVLDQHSCERCDDPRQVATVTGL